ncbi:hypothetical protein CEN50_06055 [Fischerella thermalis CCMEE 5268]|uniref:Uncharacterized protein n=1 Tax=Fischerella thermalis CCMEE 5268 TaxID=2019662 RepID=A0A2N6KJG7_9CYAN|nr:hypothetical protein [Fischerella thermalis]PLZ99745.1 hypothetical protein CEN50_06055 [Fischerella thermalis CCMEE 5268]
MVSDRRQLHRQNYFQRCLGILAGVAIFSQSQVWAQSLILPEPKQIYELATPQELSIPPQQLGDILPNSVSETVKNEQDLTAPPVLTAVVTRELPGLWQMRVPIDEVGSVYATYEIKGMNGQANGFSNNTRSDRSVRVSVEPLPIVEISRDESTNTALIQGGIRLHFDLSTARVAGGYGGVIKVTVNKRE